VCREYFLRANPAYAGRPKLDAIRSIQWSREPQVLFRAALPGAPTPCHTSTVQAARQLPLRAIFIAQTELSQTVRPEGPATLGAGIAAWLVPPV
jgi:hypothetical protein